MEGQGSARGSAAGRARDESDIGRRVSLVHPWLVLHQTEMTREAAGHGDLSGRCAMHHRVLSGYEPAWLLRQSESLRDALQRTALTIHNSSSLELVRTLHDGKIALAFLRQEDAEPEPAFRVVMRGPLFARLRGHYTPLKRRIIHPDDINGEAIINS